MNRQTTDVFATQSGDPNANVVHLDVRRAISFFTRNKWFFALAMASGIMLSLAYLATTTRIYTSAVEISLGTTPDTQTFLDFSGVSGARQPILHLETEIQVLRSERIAERVVRSLDLHESEAFIQRPQTGISRAFGYVFGLREKITSMIRGIFADGTPDFTPSEADRQNLDIERAARILRSNMSVSSIRDSSVVQVQYRSVSPRLSAQVANGIAAAYIEDQLQSTDEASQRAIDWLRERTDQLRDQSERLSAIAEDFRVANDLLGVDIDRLADAEFETLTRNLVDARARLVDLEALSRRLDQIVASNDTSAVVRETATQGITAGLRSRYLEVARSYNNLASTLGEDHAQTERRRRELDDIEAMMFEEIRRSAELIRSDLNAARERVASLKDAQSEASLRVGADQSVLTQLRELERNAETVRSLYTSYLQRYQEALQRQQIPTSSARVLNRAQPGGQSFPRPNSVLAMGGLGGFFLAILLMGFREFRDNKVRSEDHVRDDLGLEFLGGLTIIKGRLRSVPVRQAAASELRDRELLMPETLSFATDNPISSYAEALRTGKMSISLRRRQTARGAKIGVASCFPSEGKTTTIGNFANLLAQQGKRVMLIDGDMRNPGLTRAFGREFDAGLVDVLLGDADWRGVYHTVKSTGLHVLPNSKARAIHTAELMGSDNMAVLLADLDQVYDFVLIDLPPLGPVVDARAVLDKLDGLLFVIKWGSTPVDQAQRILRTDPRLNDMCFGAFLNMFDPKKAHAYGAYSGYSQYRSYYKSYYRDG